MATKLGSKEQKQLADMGFKGLNTVEDAKRKLIKFLNGNEVEAQDDEDLKELITMAEVFVEPEEEDDEDEDQEAELEDDEDIEEEGEDEDELEEDDDEEEEEEKPAPKKSAKSAAKQSTPAPKKKAAAPKTIEPEDEDELDELSEEVEEHDSKAKKSKAKPETPAPAKKPAAPVKPGEEEKYNGRENEDHAAMVKPFEAALSKITKSVLKFDMLKQGFTVRVKGKNASVTVFNFDELKIVSGKLFGNAYFNRFKNVESLDEELDGKVELDKDSKIGMFRGESHPCIRKISQDTVIEIINDTDVMKKSFELAGATDVKMGNNRANLEESLSKGSKAKSATPAKKK